MSARKAHVISQLGNERYYEGRKVWIMRFAILWAIVAWVNSVVGLSTVAGAIGASITTCLILYVVGLWLSTERVNEQDLVCDECGTELKQTDDRCSFCGNSLES